MALLAPVPGAKWGSPVSGAGLLFPDSLPTTPPSSGGLPWDQGQELSPHCLGVSLPVMSLGTQDILREHGLKKPKYQLTPKPHAWSPNSGPGPSLAPLAARPVARGPFEAPRGSPQPPPTQKTPPSALGLSTQAPCLGAHLGSVPQAPHAPATQLASGAFPGPLPHGPPEPCGVERGEVGESWDPVTLEHGGSFHHPSVHFTPLPEWSDKGKWGDSEGTPNGRNLTTVSWAETSPLPPPSIPTSKFPLQVGPGAGGGREEEGLTVQLQPGAWMDTGRTSVCAWAGGAAAPRPPLVPILGARGTGQPPSSHGDRRAVPGGAALRLKNEIKQNQTTKKTLKH